MKYNLPDLLAAIGLVQLQKLEHFISRRNVLAERYLEALASTSLKLPAAETRPDARHAWHLFIVRTEDRDQLVARLSNRSIGTGLHFAPVHLMERFRSYTRSLPITERIAPRILSIPIYPELTDDQQTEVIEALSQLC